jgi:hypothetical protein
MLRYAKRILAGPGAFLFLFTSLVTPAKAQQKEFVGRNLSGQQGVQKKDLENMSNATDTAPISQDINTNKRNTKEVVEYEIQRLEEFVNNFKPRVEKVEVINTIYVGCVTGGTRIKLAKGGWKKVEDLSPGDLIERAGGGTGIVREIQQRQLGSQSLHGLNGAGIFFSTSHLFVTPDGYKSLNPSTHKDFAYPVAQLQVGDVMQTEAGGRTVKSIETIAAPPETVIYNLLTSHENTYVADCSGDSGGGGGGGGDGGGSGGDSGGDSGGGWSSSGK